MLTGLNVQVSHLCRPGQCTPRIVPPTLPGGKACPFSHCKQMGPREGRRPHLPSDLQRTSLEFKYEKGKTLSSLMFIHHPTSLASERPSGDMEKQKENRGCSTSNGNHNITQSWPAEL